MKKFYMTMVAMLCGVAAIAQNRLYVNDFSVKPGEEGVIAVCMANDKPVASVKFFLNDLPDGITIPDDESEFSINEDRINTSYLQEKSGKSWAGSKFYTFTCVLDGSSSNFIILQPKPAYVGYGTKEAYEGTGFLGEDGELIYIPVYVAATVEEKPYELKLTSINMPSTDYKPVPVAEVEETTFTLTVGEGTGINSIKADDNNAPIYNVAGQRVSKAQKGVFIQNGKKVAVK